MPNERGLQFVQEFTSPHEANKAHELVAGGKKDVLSLIYYHGVGQAGMTDYFLSVGLPDKELGNKVLLFKSPEQTRTRVNEWISKLHADMSADELNGLMSVLLPEKDYKALTENPIHTVRILRGDANNHDFKKPVEEENIFTHAITKSQANKPEKDGLQESIVAPRFPKSEATVDRNPNPDNKLQRHVHNYDENSKVVVKVERYENPLVAEIASHVQDLAIMGKFEKGICVGGTTFDREFTDHAYYFKNGEVIPLTNKTNNIFDPSGQLENLSINWATQAGGDKKSSEFHFIPERVRGEEGERTVLFAYALQENSNYSFAVTLPPASLKYDTRAGRHVFIAGKLNKSDCFTLLDKLREDPQAIESFIYSLIPALDEFSPRTPKWNQLALLDARKYTPQGLRTRNIYAYGNLKTRDHNFNAVEFKPYNV